MTAPVAELAARIAAAVLAHPAVAGLHGGPFNAVATHLPGRRLLGVRIGRGSEPVELAVVLRLDRPFPEVVADLRAIVAPMCGRVPVDITVADVAVPEADGAAPAPAAVPADVTVRTTSSAHPTGPGVAPAPGAPVPGRMER